MNDIQLYNYYCSIPLAPPGKRSRIYPKYVKITGRAFCAPHPHRHFNLEEFIDVLNKDPEFRKILLKS